MISATSARRNTLRVPKVYVTACLCLFIAWVLESHQQSPKKNETKDFIERIDVEGYRRLELATIRAHFLSRPGDLYSAEVVQRDAQTLRDTRYFEGVRLLVEDSPDRQNGKIVEFVLREKPVVRRLEYRGVKSITRADILNAFKYQQVGLSAGEWFDDTKLKRAKTVIEELLSVHGHPSATVKPTYERSVSSNEVTILFSIDEGTPE